MDLISGEHSHIGDSNIIYGSPCDQFSTFFNKSNKTNLKIRKLEKRNHTIGLNSENIKPTIASIRQISNQNGFIKYGLNVIGSHKLNGTFSLQHGSKYLGQDSALN